MIPTPIRQVLSTIRTDGVQALLMGGQTCVFYGAAQVSKDIDLVLRAEAANFQQLHKALEALQPRRIDVPRFDPELLECGHAVHFRCGPNWKLFAKMNFAVPVLNQLSVLYFQGLGFVFPGFLWLNSA